MKFKIKVTYLNKQRRRNKVKNPKYLGSIGRKNQREERVPNVIGEWIDLRDWNKAKGGEEGLVRDREEERGHGALTKAIIK